VHSRGDFSELARSQLFRACSSLYWAREDSSPEPIVDSELAVNGTSWFRSDSPTHSRATAAPRSRWSGAAKERELSKKLYVGNLPFSVTESDLRSLFQSHGAVESVNVIMDRETGRARGFAFVEMQEASDAANAIRALDGTDMGGRSLRVNEAQDKRGGGGGGGFNRGGGGGGRRDRY